MSATAPRMPTPPLCSRWTTPSPRLEGLVGCWRLDDGSGTVARDTSNFGQHGSLVYPGENPATWVSGLIGGALDFDGVDDLVTIPGSGALAGVTGGSHTMVAWVKAHDVPPNTADNNTYYSILTRQGTGLFYTYTGKIQGGRGGERWGSESGGVGVAGAGSLAPRGDGGGHRGRQAAALCRWPRGWRIAPRPFPARLPIWLPTTTTSAPGILWSSVGTTECAASSTRCFSSIARSPQVEIAALAIDAGPLEILVDGFESGDTAAWSMSTP